MPLKTQKAGRLGNRWALYGAAAAAVSVAAAPAAGKGWAVAGLAGGAAAGIQEACLVAKYQTPWLAYVAAELVDLNAMPQAAAAAAALAVVLVAVAAVAAAVAAVVAAVAATAAAAAAADAAVGVRFQPLLAPCIHRILEPNQANHAEPMFSGGYQLVGQLVVQALPGLRSADATVRQYQTDSGCIFRRRRARDQGRDRGDSDRGHLCVAARVHDSAGVDRHDHHGQGCRTAVQYYTADHGTASRHDLGHCNGPGDLGDGHPGHRKHVGRGRYDIRCRRRGSDDHGRSAAAPFDVVAAPCRREGPRSDSQALVGFPDPDRAPALPAAGEKRSVQARGTAARDRPGHLADRRTRVPGLCGVAHSRTRIAHGPGAPGSCRRLRAGRNGLQAAVAVSHPFVAWDRGPSARHRGAAAEQFAADPYPASGY